MNNITAVAAKCQAALDAGDYELATQLWSQAEAVCDHVTGGVNFYNILDWDPGYSPTDSTSLSNYLGNVLS